MSTPIEKVYSIHLAMQGENATTPIEIDMTSWAAEFPDATFYVLFKPYNTTNVVPVITEYTYPVLKWVPTSSVTAIVGVGYTEVRAVDPDTGLVKKSRIIPTTVENSVSGNEGIDPPDAYVDWVNSVLAAKDTAVDAKEDAEDAQVAAENAQVAAENAQVAAENAQAAAEEAAENAAEIVEEEFDATADYVYGDYVTHNGALYRATEDITAGSTFNPSQWEKKTVMDTVGTAVLYTPQALSTAQCLQAAENINALSKEWGQTLTADQKQSVRDKIGLSFIDWNLNYTDAQKQYARRNFNAADIGNAKTPEMYGAKGDGVTDDGNALLSAFSEASAAGVPVVLGYGKTYAIGRFVQMTGHRINVYGNGATIKVLTGTPTLNEVLFITDVDDGQFPDTKGKGLIENLTIDCNGLAKFGIHIGMAKGYELQNLDICGFTEKGLLITSGFEIFCHNIRIAGSGVAGSVGLRMDTSDSRFVNIVTKNVAVGIENHGAANYYTHVHAWNTIAAIASTSIMFDSYADLHASDCYVDTCAIGIYQHSDDAVEVNGLTIVNSGSLMSNTPTVFKLTNPSYAARVHGTGMVYLSDADYNMFETDVSQYAKDYDWLGNNDSSTHGMRNMPNAFQPGGISAALKSALLQLAEKVGYIDQSGPDCYQDLYDALYVNTQIASITAVLDLEDHAVTAGDSLDTLRPYLTVTVVYEDESQRTVSDYTLSGTIVVGINTITVSYEGETDTFTVFGNVPSDLPAGYTSIPSLYCAGEGTLYLDPGVSSGDFDYAEYSIMPTNLNYRKAGNIFSGAGCWFPYLTGDNTNGDRSRIGFKNMGNQERAVTDGSYLYPWNFNERHTIMGFVDGKVYVDGVELFTVPAGSAVSSPMWIFNNPEDGNNKYFIGRLYWLKLYKNGAVYRNYIPCKNSSNVVGLYETATGTFVYDTTDSGLIREGGE